MSRRFANLRFELTCEGPEKGRYSPHWLASRPRSFAPFRRLNRAIKYPKENIRYLSLKSVDICKNASIFALCCDTKNQALRAVMVNLKRKEVISSMKKLISLALCLALALAFAAGCKKKEEAPAPAAEQAAPAAPAAPAQAPMSSAKAAPAAPAAK
jgi:hypothetical protein